MMKNKKIDSNFPLKISASDDLPKWLHEKKIALGFTARRANKLFLAGVNQERELSIFERTFENASGLVANGNYLFLASQYQVWFLSNGLLPGQTQNGYDRIYLPQVAYTTGDCAVHEMALNSNGKLIFVNTRFFLYCRLKCRPQL